MPAWDFVSAPPTLKVRFSAPVVPILLHSLGLLSEADNLSGLPEWIYKTEQAMSAEQRYDSRLCDLLMPSVLPSSYNENLSFPQFIQQLQASDPLALREESLGWIREREDYPGLDVLLADVEVFIGYVRSLYIQKGMEINEALWRDAYFHLQDPPRAKARLLSFLPQMWEQFLRPEWQRVEKYLNEVVKAHSQLNYDGQAWGDIIEQVASRDMRQQEKLAEYFNAATSLHMIPSPHLGPYISYYQHKPSDEVVLFFGARMPHAPRKAGELDRADLLVRLNALADETRLRMIELLAQREEICAQDFMTLLDLSQSSASRHLRQLTASGYLTERRRDVAKCYSLNRERLADTLKALNSFVEPR